MSESFDLPVRRFTADEVLRMVEVGILGEDERVELLDGRLVEMSPQGPRHRYLKDWLRRFFASAWTDRYVMEQSPVRVNEWHLPEPDLAVVRGRLEDWRDRHPEGSDALLVVEISQSTTKTDRSKAAVYARGRVPVYWLVDVEAERIEVYEGPTDDGRYGRVRLVNDGEIELPETDVRLIVPELFA